MNFEEISADEFGRSLNGFGLNLLVKETASTIQFLQAVFGFQVLRQSEDYAILKLDSANDGNEGLLLQLHADQTYSSNPLPSLLPENGARGGGIELRLYDIDPDEAEARARKHDYLVLQESTDKPHGLRECFILDPNGYCWVPSRPLAA
ncbi:MAG: VOC family protein [Acidiferrobacterales bacterium]|nr:VOC family protein [Acidiferrobacterales bacterium]